jgi:VanZ family protein
LLATHPRSALCLNNPGAILAPCRSSPRYNLACTNCSFLPGFARGGLLWPGPALSSHSRLTPSPPSTPPAFSPHLSEDQFDFIHHIIRKSAHFIEYFIFCLLIYRGVRGGRKGWRWTWGLAALSVAAGYSIMDEIHQAFVASRTASPYDSLLDSIGAFFACAALWLWFRLRRNSGRTTDSSA